MYRYLPTALLLTFVFAISTLVAAQDGAPATEDATVPAAVQDNAVQNDGVQNDGVQNNDAQDSGTQVDAVPTAAEKNRDTDAAASDEEEDFIPSEDIPTDQSIAFPTDI